MADVYSMNRYLTSFEVDETDSKLLAILEFVYNCGMHPRITTKSKGTKTPQLLKPLSREALRMLEADEQNVSDSPILEARAKLKTGHLGAGLMLLLFSFEGFNASLRRDQEGRDQEGQDEWEIYFRVGNMEF